jgi:hypothetical protein
MKKIMMLALALGLAVILAACGNDDQAKDKEKEKDSQEDAAEQTQENMEITDEEKVKEDDVVVKIDDMDVKGKQYNSLYPQIKMQAAGMGQEVDQDELKDQTVEALVGQTLLKQEAEKKGIKVSDKEVDKQVDEFKAQSEEQYDAFLEQYQLTEETLKDQLAFELMLDKYAEKEFDDLKVTDDEIEEMYEQLKMQGGEDQDIPELKEVKDQIKTQISQQKKQEKTQEKIEELRKKADVKSMI